MAEKKEGQEEKGAGTGVNPASGEKGAFSPKPIDLERLFFGVQSNLAKEKSKKEITEFLSKLADEKLYPLDANAGLQYNEYYDDFEVLIPWFTYDENGYYVQAGTLSYVIHINKNGCILSNEEVKKQIEDVKKDYLNKVKEREERQQEVEAVE